MSTYGKTIAYAVNNNGFSELYLRGYETGGKPLITVVDKRSQKVTLPGQGVIGGIALDRSENLVAFSFASPTRNSDIWVYDRARRSRSEEHTSELQSH